MSKIVNNVRELDVYIHAFEAAMRIFHISKRFPPEEKYSLTDQIRRSSRSVCSNLAESFRKRKYIAVFKNKLADAMQEASETQTWLEFAYACGYITQDEYTDANECYERVIAQLNTMDMKAESFCYVSRGQ